MQHNINVTKDYLNALSFKAFGMKIMIFKQFKINFRVKTIIFY